MVFFLSGPPLEPGFAMHASPTLQLPILAMPRSSENPSRKLLKALAQRLISPEEQGFGGGFAQLEHCADLLVVQVLILVHKHCGALPLGKSQNVLPDGTQAFIAQQ